MGRYDKIKVYDGSTWRQPTEIRVYNNGVWNSLGLNDSSETKSLHVLKDNNFVRATLNKDILVHYGDTYSYGNEYSLSGRGSNGALLRYCHEKSLGDWFFRATIKRTDGGAKRIFRLGTDNNYIDIMWNADGTITVSNKSTFGDGKEYRVTTSNAVPAGQWVYLDVTAPKKGSTVYITFNGVTTTGSLQGTWNSTNATYKIGNTGLLYKDYMSIQGRDYYQGQISIAINMSDAIDVANKCSGATTVTDTTTEVVWI